MLFISHRGNLTGKNPKRENSPSYVLEALNAGYQVEIDVWYENGWWLGHNKPQYKTTFQWIRNHLGLWIHCKNKEALQKIQDYAIKKGLNFNFLNYFWHQDDDYTITSKGFVWIRCGQPIINKGICVLPEQYVPSLNFNDISACYGICSDKIEYFYKKKNSLNLQISI